MTINNGTKKIEAPPKEIPCTYYAGSSVGRISVVIKCEFFSRPIARIFTTLTRATMY